MAARPDVMRAEQQLASMLEPAAGVQGRRQRRGGRIAPSVAAVSVLSRRECDVLRLVAKGLSNQRVAEQLFISEHTVHRHVANILTKLDVPSRSAAVAAGRAARTARAVASACFRRVVMSVVSTVPAAAPERRDAPLAMDTATSAASAISSWTTSRRGSRPCRTGPSRRVSVRPWCARPSGPTRRCRRRAPHLTRSCAASRSTCSIIR